MRRRLRWLGHLERMDNSHLPKCLLVCRLQVGKRAAGGQKRRWNDVVLRDLRICGLLSDWREVAHERGTWRGLVREALQELNCSHEEEEARSKDQLKQRREAPGHPASPTPATSLPHTCTVPGCTFVGRTKAGLVNHIRQRHGVVYRVFHPFPHCRGSFCKQGLHNHSRFCRGSTAQQPNSSTSQ